MRIGLFTDTYFPQVSGVATSIRTLKDELEKLGHDVYIFTTTDKNVDRYEDPTIVRLPSVPFFAFKERRFAYGGFSTALKLAKQYKLDMIHTQTEFSLGMLGINIARELKIPVIHTYHTQYEDYVHYIAKGRLITPGMVKYFVRGYLSEVDGVICPSRIVLNLLDTYKVKIPKRVIPTGIKLENYVRNDIDPQAVSALKERLGLKTGDTMLLSLSRVSYEKNIQAILQALPEIVAQNTHIKLVVVGDGPYLDDLKKLAKKLQVTDAVVFTGMVDHDQVALYYRACDFFISASTSETQGLTYTESLASGRPIIAQSNPYLADLISDRMFGTLYEEEKDIPQAVLEAVAQTPVMTEQALTQKRYEISATNFGQQVYQFYLDVSIGKTSKERQQKLSLTVESPSRLTTRRVTRGAIALPKTVAKGAAKTSTRAIKAPKQLVTRIRDYLMED
ncbi:glycosyltransferase family 4 protein [Streptococcus sp. DD12]|uniref:glycosyltransferase family 4 protein n=1 Tax=Streptococcus sp. DD12 TaxID=1777880 RepID=UPI000793D862|nr:glycosyltransferase family 4 protein [Streptococcus sp. DD12]KXT75577.1 Glycosyltransferase LafA, responsible for the formation of Glc-DAG [Streptococcus sp. DD12]